MEKITLYGAPISPYVRKARLALAFKGIEYEHDPVVPRSPDQPEEFVANSPLRKIPLLRVGDTFIPDSSVICLSLEKIKPQPALLPDELAGYSRALWFEEYADTVMTTAIGGHLFAEVVLARALFKREPIQADIDKALGEEIPQIFDFLSGELDSPYLVGNDLSLADIAVCGLFIAMQHCGHYCDADKWPKVAEYIKRVHSEPFFEMLIEGEQNLLRSFGLKI